MEEFSGSGHMSPWVTLRNKKLFGFYYSADKLQNFTRVLRPCHRNIMQFANMRGTIYSHRRYKMSFRRIGMKSAFAQFVALVK